MVCWQTNLHFHYIWHPAVLCVFTVCLSTQEEVINSMFLFWSPFLSIVIEINKAERSLIHFHRFYMDSILLEFLYFVSYHSCFMFLTLWQKWAIGAPFRSFGIVRFNLWKLQSGCEAGRETYLKMSRTYHTVHVLKWVSILFLFRKMDRVTVK